jgi:RNA polymerase II subunit A-like phosphatase
MIVGLSWLTSCIALWRRVDETPHLLEDTPAAAPGHSSSTTTEQQSAPAEGSTSEFNEGDGAGDGTGEETESFAINEINWADINDEVEAAMNESDDGDDDDGDDDDSDMSAMRSGNVSENEVSRNAHDGVSRLVRPLILALCG